ncbi:MAG TPA: flagellar biosynthetic protein FliR [Steroidobacteraceae bacterium]|jgi:flagellar biosynthetic protein FliR
MTLRVDIGWLLATLLLSVRVAAATALAPVFGPDGIPGTVRVALAVGLSVAVVSALPVAPVAIASLAQLGVAALVEALIGLSLTFGFLTAYAATQVAGRTLDIQIGFGVASVLNPSTRTFGPLLGTLLGMLAIAVFLGLDGHHVLIEALARSARAVPPGSMAVAPDWEAVLMQSAVMFTFGAAFAMPVMLLLLLADIAMAVMARSMPMMNVFALSFAVKAVLGIAGLAVSVRLSAPLLGALFDRTYRYWGAVSGAQ